MPVGFLRKCVEFSNYVGGSALIFFNCVTLLPSKDTSHNVTVRNLACEENKIASFYFCITLSNLSLFLQVLASICVNRFPIIRLLGRSTLVGKALSFTHDFFSFFSFLTNPPCSEAPQCMALKCISEVRS